jgi:hypothetical protein
VLVVLPILSGEHRLLGFEGDLREVDRDPIGVAEATEFGLAIGPVDDRGLRGRNGRRFGDGGEGKGRGKSCRDGRP